MLDTIPDLKKELELAEGLNKLLVERLDKTRRSLAEFREATDGVFVKAVLWDKVINKGSNIAVICEDHTSLIRCWKELVDVTKVLPRGNKYFESGRVIFFTDGGCIKLLMDSKREDYCKGLKFNQIVRYFW